jgi:carbon monoxide dehydrogenase subunit G
MKLEGSFAVPASKDTVWATINDVGVMASCVPGCEGVQRLSETSYKAAVKADVGIIRARFNLVIEIVHTEPTDLMRFTSRGEEGSHASMLMSENSVVLVALSAQETQVTVTSDVSVTGRLGKFGLGVMKKKAEAITREFADALRAAVIAAPAAPAAPGVEAA